MKRIILVTLLIVSFSKVLFAQNIGIGTTTPNASSILEIKASNKGLLIPRTSTTSRIAIVNPAKGLMVYDTTTSSFWYHSGSAWTQISSASGTSRGIKGNANTDSAINFIGTSNPQALVFKVNNQRAGFLGYGTSNTSFGYNALTPITSGNYNTASGTGSLLENTTGYNNIAHYHKFMTNTGKYMSAFSGRYIQDQHQISILRSTKRSISILLS
jgi:trimeric autotransporter adhesin